MCDINSIEERMVNFCGVDYIVSSDGHIYSTKSIGRGKYHQEIKQRKNEDGYMEFTAGLNGHRKKKKVYQIIAEAFLGPKPTPKHEVNHINRDRANNCADNLEWVTHLENIALIPFDIHSASNSGEHNGRAILTEEQVRDIRRLYDNKLMNISQIANEFHIGWTTVSHIVKRETWKNIN